MSVTLERMRWWHLADVLRIEQQAFSEPWSAEQLWSELAAGAATRCYLVAIDDRDRDEVVGYGGVVIGPDAAEVMTLAVHPERRRRGLGQRLLDALLDEARRRRLPQVLLEVRADNEAALALYRRAGFEPLSRRRGYYGPGADALVLRARAGAVGG